MLHGSHSPGVAGSELTRLLARLGGTPPTDTRPAFAERLGHWLSWTGAISLSKALNAGPCEPAASRSPGVVAPASRASIFAQPRTQLLLGHHYRFFPRD